MKTEEFDLSKWMKKDSGKSDAPLSAHPGTRTVSGSLFEDVETVTGRIEARQVDITGDYECWRDIGFALADGLGEAGREYFHRVSRFYKKYNAKEADSQFTHCLKGRKTGITIKSFFQKAKDAGIDIRTKICANVPIMPIVPAPRSGAIMPDADGGTSGTMAQTDQLPTFSERVEQNLPHFLQLVAARGNDWQEKDILILGSIVTLSACLPNVSGLYREEEVYPNLFFFLTAKASSGKGRLNLCRLLVEPIHERLFEIYKLERQEYEMKKRDFESSKTPGIPKPTPPMKNMLFIPANSSATSVYQILGESQERGLIFETEGDTLAYSFASDFGNFSDGFRKAFHHEPISYHRRKDDEHVDLKHPQLSTVLSGTPEQLRSLIKDAENGLFSRFIYYRLNTGPVWKDVFATPTGKSLNKVFEELGVMFAEFHEKLQDAPQLAFCLTEPQGKEFNSYFEELLLRLYNIYGDPIAGSVKRMGLICFRIAMILSTLRIMETGDFYSNIVCTNEDFDNAMTMARILILHTEDVYVELCGDPYNPIIDRSDNKMKLLQALPEEFNRSVFLETAAGMGIPVRTASRYIAQLCQSRDIEKQSRGTYTKALKKE